ncbi:MAG: chaperonin 10-like protein [Benjaminiella poitrasii]|nr:MAG: chaperonin 10-like protein [Benjaminiella poitrasii]
MNRLRILGLTSFTQQARTTASFAFKQQSRIIPRTLNGWACFGKSEPLVKAEFPLTEFGDDSVDMDIICCGVCGTDIHTIDSGWGQSNYPLVAGHEIIGRVTRVGKNVKHLKVGDRAGVGCQCGSCNHCKNCKDHKENLCEDHAIWTFNDHWSNGDTTYGGFADRWRGNKDFAFKIPNAIPSVDAASILCGGVTTYAPMKRYGVGEGSKVAVLGLGGLGHFGVQWAKALGAKVVAYDVVPEKVEDAKALGCDDYVLVQKPDQLERHMDSFTHILGTKIINKSWDDYFRMLKKNGVFIACDIPEVPFSGLNALNMAAKQITVAGSFIGSPDDIREALDVAAKNGIRTWANEFPMDKINDAIEFVRKGHPRYRAVLVN